jgi:L-ascorbate metabolism protein UlaG (beta-lactamase superfamily)
MEIKYLGLSSFKLRGKGASVITDPYDSDMVGIKFPNQKAEIVTVSHDHKDHNQVNQVKETKKILTGPGEYEISDVSIIGIPSYHDDKKGSERGKNTIFIFEMDGLRIAHLGDLGHKLKEEHYDEMGEIDILIIPVGGKFTIDGKTAVEIAREIEPSIIIPMHFLMPNMNKKTFGELSDLKPFLNEIGLPVGKMDKLSIKGETLGEDQRVVVLELAK